MNHNHAPVVSVIMSVYNARDYLKESIESILSQTFEDFEFIIIDDGSTDRTLEIFESYNDARLKIYNQNNMGLTKSLNKAIKISKGRFIARIDADEIAAPTRLAKQVEFLANNPQIGIVGSFCVNFDEVNQTVQEIKVPVFADEMRKALIRKNVFIHGTVMVRREVFESIGYYDESFKYMQDYECWGRIAKLYKMQNLPEFLLKRIVTKESLSNNPQIMKERALLGIKAQLSVIRNLNAPFYYYCFLWKRLLRFLLYHLKFVRVPLRSKEDLLRAFKRQS